MNYTSTIDQPRAEQAAATDRLQPLPLWLSGVLFAVPAAVLFFAFHAFRPWLERLGYSPLQSYLASLTVPTALLFAAALITYNRIEGRPLTWQAFGARMRFPALRWQDIGYALGQLVVLYIGYYLFGMLALTLINAGIVPLPANVPLVNDPRVAPTPEALITFAGGPLRGQWDTVALYLALFFFNIVGEELWWRGIILPRQELTHGRFTWLVHGLLWTLFHMFKWWDLIGLLPVCLGISFAAQRLRPAGRQSNWPALIAHAIFNAPGLLIVICYAAGWIG